MADWKLKQQKLILGQEESELQTERLGVFLPCVLLAVCLISPFSIPHHKLQSFVFALRNYSWQDQGCWGLNPVSLHGQLARKAKTLSSVALASATAF